MQTRFEEINLYAYNTMRGKFYDLLIWCLEPVIEDSRDFGLTRLYLAAITCKLYRSWARIE